RRCAAQKLTDQLVRGLSEFAKESDKRWSAFMEELWGPNTPRLKPTAIIIKEAMREYLEKSQI
ncbi:unnamed protein product, partial [marine sediment metagenome]